ncbi:MAG: DNA repair exonuclease [candidate division Zixibacteria bacterium]|nr:DNA repair exonuclease [candidate division Zixibacteria bacterium]
MIKILHTADIHLGREFPSLRKKGKEYRRQLLTTFEQIMKLAIDQQVSLIVIAGDLFDANRIHGVVVGKVLSEFQELEKREIRVCICPGTHDAYTDESIYRFVGFPSNVTVFTPDHDHEIFDDLDLTVYGKAFDGKLVGKSPLRELSLVKESKFHVGIAHCSIKVERLIEKDLMILDKKEIETSGLDYLALGHWHSFQDHSQGNTIAYYCGSPEPIYMDQKGAGSVAMIDIYEKGNIEVNPIRVGSKEFDEMTIDVGRINSINDIAKIIEPKANPNLILKVTLEGLCSMDCDLNPQEIEDKLSDRFFSLRVLDKSHPKLEKVQVEDFPEDTVIGRFVRILEEKIAEVNEKDKLLHEDALKLGFALLRGRGEVIE